MHGGWPPAASLQLLEHGRAAIGGGQGGSSPGQALSSYLSFLSAVLRVICGWCCGVLWCAVRLGSWPCTAEHSLVSRPSPCHWAPAPMQCAAPGGVVCSVWMVDAHTLVVLLGAISTPRQSWLAQWVVSSPASAHAKNLQPGRVPAAATEEGPLTFCVRVLISGVVDLFVAHASSCGDLACVCALLAERRRQGGVTVASKQSCLQPGPVLAKR